MATILIVDDSTMNRQFLAGLLGRRGHRLLEAGDGVEALEIARSEKADLVIADILMPRMDGFELVRQLRGDPAIAHSNVIFYTAAYNEDEARALARRCGVSRVLVKPSEPEEILEVVNAALGHAGARTPLAELSEFDDDHMRLLTDKLSQKVSELEAVSLRFGALIDLGQELASERDTDHLLELVCRAARGIVRAEFATLGILDETGRSLRHFVASGSDEDTALRAVPPAPSQGILGALIERRRPCRLRAFEDPRAVGLPLVDGHTPCFLGVPIMTLTQVYGWVCLAGKPSREEFDDEDERLAATVAAQGALAYENTRRYVEIQRRAAELEREISERTRAERSLEEKARELSRSNDELERFAYVASHDLQEPLRMVASFTQLLAERYQGRLDADADDFIRFAVEGAHRMQRLISDLLEYSRIGSGDAEMLPTNCEKALEAALENLKTAIEDARALVTHDPLPTIEADEVQIVQLLQNLVGNAIKFRGTHAPSVHVAAERRGDEWVFSVRDNGIGVDRRHAERIFQLFQRLHATGEYPGSGIGLALCKKIVERQGGRIWVESEPGSGATFFFSIPTEGALERRGAERRLKAFAHEAARDQETPEWPES